MTPPSATGHEPVVERTITVTLSVGEALEVVAAITASRTRHEAYIANADPALGRVARAMVARLDHAAAVLRDAVGRVQP